MADTKELIAKRKEAYEYIVNTLSQPPWHIPLPRSDERLADILGGTVGLTDSIQQLREGTQNPTNVLLTAFRDLVEGIVADSTIDEYLVAPFQNP